MEETGFFCPPGYHAISTIPKAKQSDHVPCASASEQGQAAAFPSTDSSSFLGNRYSGRCHTLTLPFPAAQDGVRTEHRGRLSFTAW